MSIIFYKRWRNVLVFKLSRFYPNYAGVSSSTPFLKLWQTFIKQSLLQTDFIRVKIVLPLMGCQCRVHPNKTRPVLVLPQLSLLHPIDLQVNKIVVLYSINISSSNLLNLILLLMLLTLLLMFLVTTIVQINRS